MEMSVERRTTDGSLPMIPVYRRYCVRCDMRPFIVHGAVGGICLLLLTWSHPWLVEVVVRCIHIWSWRNVDPGLGPTASSCPVSSDVDPVVCGDT